MDRPVVRCIVGWHLGDGDHYVRRAPFGTTDATVTLEAAEDFAANGWVVIVDPFDHEALTRWEQQQRYLDWRR